MKPEPGFKLTRVQFDECRHLLNPECRVLCRICDAEYPTFPAPTNIGWDYRMEICRCDRAVHERYYAGFAE